MFYQSKMIPLTHLHCVVLSLFLCSIFSSTEVSAKPALSASYLSPSQNARRLSPAFAHALFPAAWATKYGMVPLIQKDLITDLRRLSEKALNFRRHWQEQQVTPNTVKTPVAPSNNNDSNNENPTDQAHRLTKLQLRDCVYIRTGCTDPLTIDMARSYLDNVQTIMPQNIDSSIYRH